MVLPSATIPPPPPIDKCTIYGRVTDKATGYGISARITVIETGFAQNSGTDGSSSAGYYTLSNMPPPPYGSYRLQVTRTGYTTQVQTVSIVAGQMKEANIQLVRTSSPPSPPDHPPSTPVPTSPSNGQVLSTTSFSFQWTSVSGATAYQIQVFDPTGTTKYVDKGVSSNLYHTTLEPGKYIWWVRASNEVGNSEWSSVWSFTISISPTLSPPILSSPTDGAALTSSDVSFSWGSSSGATDYEIQVSGPTSKDETVYSTSFTCTLSDGSYTWSVRAHDTIGYGGWSSSWRFTISNPPPSKCTISGRITDVETGQGIAADLTVVEDSYTTRADAQGYYALSNRPAPQSGSYSIRVTASGYDSETKTVSISAGQSKVLDFQLTKTSSGGDGGSSSDVTAEAGIIGTVTTVLSFLGLAFLKRR
jgi:hypothetical protein